VGEEEHDYIPPASERWEYTDKISGGIQFQELDLLPALRRLGTGGILQVLHSVALWCSLLQSDAVCRSLV